MTSEGRRRFVVGAGASLLLFGCAKGGSREIPAGSKEAKGDEGMSPSEDLMREHGVLSRILIIYEEGARRLEVGQSLPIEVVGAAADMMRRFIEQYHEKNEEDFVFTRFEKANRLVELVGTLRRQHQVGRALTDTILELATEQRYGGANSRKRLISALDQFVRMYRPHEAREDTVLLPAFRRLVPATEFDALGEQFEKREHELFGRDGYDQVVEKLAVLEKQIGTYELETFTPA